MSLNSLWDLDGSIVVQITSCRLQKEERFSWNGVVQLFGMVCKVATDTVKKSSKEQLSEATSAGL